MHTLTQEDLEDIHKSVEFAVERDDVCHGFGSWFDVAFWSTAQDKGSDQQVCVCVCECCVLCVEC